MNNENKKPVGVIGCIFAGGYSFIVLASGLAWVVAFFDLELVPADSVVSVADLQADYVHRSVIGAGYVEKSKVHKEYVLKEDVDEILQDYLPSKTISRDYVPREEYEAIAEENRRLKAEFQSIPSPFEPVRRELSLFGKWHNQRLGVYIEIKDAGGSKGKMDVTFSLELPDSPRHDERVSEDRDGVHQWQFNKAGRDFELFLERVYPPIFVVREI
ncbi:hypothetical protein [Thiomicrospira pelophila]|uniref:hypothetical protein n=1 Tax=Thiomicrospira pelophila TaxID=934 RepID=UPI0004A6EF54|nr:hypothetical protein [Thiomicrospira pelophila]